MKGNVVRRKGSKAAMQEEQKLVWEQHQLVNYTCSLHIGLSIQLYISGNNSTFSMLVNKNPQLVFLIPGLNSWLNQQFTSLLNYQSKLLLRERSSTFSTPLIFVNLKLLTICQKSERDRFLPIRIASQFGQKFLSQTVLKYLWCQPRTASAL